MRVSWTHKIIQVERDLRRPLGQPPVHRRIRPGYSDFYLTDSWKLSTNHTLGLHNFSGQLFSGLLWWQFQCCHHHREVFPGVQKEPPVFLFVSIASGPGTGPYWKEPGCIFQGITSLQLFIDIGEIPLSLLFFWRDAHSFLIPWLDSLQCVHASPVLNSPALNTALLIWTEQRWGKGSPSFPWIHSLMQPRMQLAAFGPRAHCWPTFNLVFNLSA